MAYYATVTLLVVWGFLALLALFGGIVFWYAAYAVYEQIEEQAQAVADMLTEAWQGVRPALETFRSRMLVLTNSLRIEQFRRS